MVPIDKLVLVADDQVEIANLIGMVVEDTVGSRVAVVTSGEEVVQFAEQLKPDLIVLDLMMPGLSGVEAIQRLKADEATRAIPVIAVTAAGSDPQQSALAAGCIGVIEKPFDVVDLAERVQRHLAVLTAQAT